MLISKELKKLTVSLKGNKIQKVKSFRSHGSLVTEDMKCTNEVTVKVATVKEAFGRKRRIFCSKLDLEFGNAMSGVRSHMERKRGL